MISTYAGLDLPDELFSLSNLDEELNLAKLIASTITNPVTAIEAAELVLDAKVSTEKIASLFADFSLPVDVLYSECKRIVANVSPASLEAFEHYMLSNPATESMTVEEQVRWMLNSIPTKPPVVIDK